MSRGLKNFIFIGLISSVLLSCGSVQKFPLARFSNSEVTGATRVRVETGVNKAVRLQPSEDLRADTVSQNPIVSNSLAPFIKPTLGVTDSIDLDVYVGSRQGLQTALKIQFLGAPMAAAPAGNFSLAFRIGYSLYVGAEEINAGDTFATPLRDRTMLIDSGYSMMELLMGYRIIQPLLVTIGYFKDSGKYNLKFKEGDRTTISHEIAASGPLLNILFQPGALLAQLSLSQGTFELPNRNFEESYLCWGLSVGLLF